MFETVNTIVFDLDGTLLNTDDLVINSYREVFKTYRPNYKLTKEEEISFLGPTLKSMFLKYFNNDMDDLLNTYHDYARKHTLEQAKLYPYAEEILIYLREKGYRVILFTSRFKSSCEEMLSSFDLAKYFDMVITLDEVKNPKPSPEGLELIKKVYNLQNNQIIFIGDNKSDLDSGKSAHVYTSLVSWSKGRNNSLLNPELLINNFKDLENIF